MHNPASNLCARPQEGLSSLYKILLQQFIEIQLKTFEERSLTLVYLENVLEWLFVCVASDWNSSAATAAAALEFFHDYARLG